MPNALCVPKGCPLRPREWEALRLLAEGHTRSEIAVMRQRSNSTIRTLLHTTYQKLKVRNGTQAIAVAYSAGWLDPVDTDWEDGRVTAAQHLYLQAFDRFLAARHHPKVQAQERMWMHHHLKTLCGERGIANLAESRVDKRLPDHGLERLMAVLDVGR